VSLFDKTKQPRSQGFSRPSHLQGKSPGNEVEDENGTSKTASVWLQSYKSY